MSDYKCKQTTPKDNLEDNFMTSPLSEQEHWAKNEIERLRQRVGELESWINGLEVETKEYALRIEEKTSELATLKKERDEAFLLSTLNITTAKQYELLLHKQAQTISDLEKERDDLALSLKNSNESGKRLYQNLSACEKERDELKRLPSPDITWLFTHCRAIGMTEKSLSGKWEDDIALFTTRLKEQLAVSQVREQKMREALILIENAYGAHITDTVSAMKLIAKNAQKENEI